MAEEKKKSRKERMYDKDKQPRMERDKKGDMAVTKGKVKNEEKEAGAEGAMREPEEHGADQDMGARHSMDRLSMHTKHEGEHMAHKEGDKKEMHGRHQKEIKDMHKRHEKEMDGKEGADGEEMIEKVESDKKEE